MNRNRGAELLRATGVSVRQIAERLGVKSPSQVHRWLQGTEPPSTQRRVQIEAAWPAVYQASWDEPAGAGAAAPAPAPAPAQRSAAVAPSAGPPEMSPRPTPMPPRPALVPPLGPTAAPSPTEVGTVLDE